MTALRDVEPDPLWREVSLAAHRRGRRLYYDEPEFWRLPRVIFGRLRARLARPQPWHDAPIAVRVPVGGAWRPPPPVEGMAAFAVGPDHAGPVMAMEWRSDDGTTVRLPRVELVRWRVDHARLRAAAETDLRARRSLLLADASLRAAVAAGLGPGAGVIEEARAGQRAAWEAAQERLARNPLYRLLAGMPA